MEVFIRSYKVSFAELSLRAGTVGRKTNAAYVFEYYVLLQFPLLFAPLVKMHGKFRRLQHPIYRALLQPAYEGTFNNRVITRKVHVTI